MNLQMRFESRCENCKYFKGGHCRKHAPSFYKIVGMQQYETILQWPEVYSNDWCGDFKLRALSKMEIDDLKNAKHQDRAKQLLGDPQGVYDETKDGDYISLPDGMDVVKELNYYLKNFSHLEKNPYDSFENYLISVYVDMNFVECESCRKKPGMIILCDGCLRNRKTISLLKKLLKKKDANK